MPKVSIITTCYNHSLYISDTIESILGQSFSDWELLIWDDNSPDNSFDIIQEYVSKDHRIKAWKHPENLGIVGNLNFLLDQVDSTARYICFLEWDDMYTPDNIEKKLKIFEQYPRVKLVYNNLDFIDQHWKVFHKDFLKNTPFYLKDQILSQDAFMKHERWYGSYSSLMVDAKTLRQEPIVNCHPSDTLFCVSDWDLVFRISSKYHC